MAMLEGIARDERDDNKLKSSGGQEFENPHSFPEMIQPEVIMAAILLFVVAFSAIILCLCVDVITIIKSRGSTLLSRDSATKEQMRRLKKSLYRSGLAAKTLTSSSKEEAASNRNEIPSHSCSSINSASPGWSSPGKLPEKDTLLTEEVGSISPTDGVSSNKDLFVVASVHCNAFDRADAASSDSKSVQVKIEANDKREKVGAGLPHSSSWPGEQALNYHVTEDSLSDTKNSKSKQLSEVVLELSSDGAKATNTDVIEMDLLRRNEIASEKRDSCKNCNAKEPNRRDMQSYYLKSISKIKINNPSTTLSSVPPQTNSGGFQKANFSGVRYNHSLVVKTHSNYLKQKSTFSRHTPIISSSLHGAGIQGTSPFSSSSPSPSSLSSSSHSGNRAYRSFLEDIKEDISRSEEDSDDASIAKVHPFHSMSSSQKKQSAQNQLSRPLSSLNQSSGS